MQWSPVSVSPHHSSLESQATPSQCRPPLTPWGRPKSIVLSPWLPGILPVSDYKLLFIRHNDGLVLLDISWAQIWLVLSSVSSMHQLPVLSLANLLKGTISMFSNNTQFRFKSAYTCYWNTTWKLYLISTPTYSLNLLVSHTCSNR